VSASPSSSPSPWKKYWAQRLEQKNLPYAKDAQLRQVVLPHM
jgi:hypothetical protein